MSAYLEYLTLFRMMLGLLYAAYFTRDLSDHGKNEVLVITVGALTLIPPIIVITGLINLISKLEEKRQKFIDDYEFPVLIARKVKKHYPHLTDADAALVIPGLQVLNGLAYQLITG